MIGVLGLGHNLFLKLIHLLRWFTKKLIFEGYFLFFGFFQNKGMGSIKRLPDSVHSIVRSSVILFDLPRVVEELIYNSIDSGSTKVLSLHFHSCWNYVIVV